MKSSRHFNPTIVGNAFDVYSGMEQSDYRDLLRARRERPRTRRADEQRASLI